VVDARVQHEQSVLLDKLAQIDKLVEELSDKKTDFTTKVDLIIQQKRKERVEKIKAARAQPYLGRMDVIQADGKTVHYYVGKTAIGDDYSDKEIVIDWRSDFGQMYTTYSGGKKEWSGIGRLVGKRQITMKRHRISRVVDVGQVERPLITGPQQGLTNTTDDISNEQFLMEILGQTTEGYQIQEIISSLQEEQDEIIRLPMDHPVIVQGVAGSGKSSVALHRISYLLFRYESTLKPGDIMVVAPNKMFISYMQGILPELDIQGIHQNTFIGIATKLLGISEVESQHVTLSKIINQEESDANDESVLKYKGSLAFKHALQIYLDFQMEQNRPRKGIYVNASFSITKEQIQGIYQGYNNYSFNKCRDLVVRSVKNLVSDEVKRQHKLIDSQFQHAVETWVDVLPQGNSVRKTLYTSLEQARDLKKEKISTECKVAIDEFIRNWGPINTKELYLQLFDEEFLMGLDSTLHRELARLICDQTGNQIAYDDLAALLYVEDRINGIDFSFQYMIIDEAQDLNPFQLSMLRQFTNSLTILGDITQSIFPNGLRSWDDVNKLVLGKESVRFMQMNTSYRSTYEIMQTANKVISNSKMNLPHIIPVNRKGGEPSIRKIENGGELLKRILESLEAFRKSGLKKVAIIGKDYKQSESIHRLLLGHGLQNLQFIENDSTTLSENIVIIPSYLVKGMEFDAVIIPNGNDQRFGLNELDAKLLYICLTRAHHALHIYYHGSISPLLKGLENERRPIVDEALDNIL